MLMLEVDYFIASAGICSRACCLQVQDMTPDSDHYPVVLSLDMPMAAFSSRTPSFQAPRLMYDSSRVEFFQTQLADNAGFMTELGSHLFDVQGLSAEQGTQLLQDCIIRQHSTPLTLQKLHQPSLATSRGLTQDAEQPCFRTRRPNRTPPVMWEKHF